MGVESDGGGGVGWKVMERGEGWKVREGGRGVVGSDGRGGGGGE